MTSHVRMLCEGAMMCALTALVLLINRIFGGMIETAFHGCSSSRCSFIACAMASRPL